MRNRLHYIWVKVKLSARTVVWLMRQWRYSLLAFIVAILFFELLYWLFNLEFLTIILMSGNVTLVEKISVLYSPLTSIAATNGLPTVIMMVCVALLQGVSIAMLTYTIRHQKKLDSELLGRSSIVSLLAIIGIGCPACGTSLLTPIVALFVSSSAVAVSERIMIVLLPLALLVGLYGLYAIGLKAATIRAKTHGVSHAKATIIPSRTQQGESK